MILLRTVSAGFGRRLTGALWCAALLGASCLIAQPIPVAAKETPEAKQWLD
jgi:hypothetical protein